MKLRIKGNSIRLRLGQSEVRQLDSEGVVAEFTDFGDFNQQRFGYALHAIFDDPTISARFADGRVIVRVPAGAIRQWAQTEQIAIHAVQRTTDGGEMLPSLLARYLAPCLNTIQTQPISIGTENPRL